MIRRHYSEGERRALNIVWDASGKYGVEPPFLAVRRDQPDFYMNLIIGLSQKWLDIDALNEFFLSYSGSERAADLDAAVWLALENWLYYKELPERPVLGSLRKAHAREFLEREGSLSQQQMMLKNTAVISVERSRWAEAAGEKEPRLSPGEKKLKQLVDYRADSATSAEVVEHLKEVLVLGLHFSDFRVDVTKGAAVAGPMRDLLSRMLHHEYHHVDSLLQRQDIGGGEDGTESGSIGHGIRDKHVAEKTDADRDYIRSCFGPCILTPKEMRLLENQLCKGTHELCSLWVAGNGRRERTNQGNVRLSEADLVDRQTLEQAKKNEAYYRKNLTLIEAAVRKLSSELETVLASFFEPLPEESRAGKLDSRRAFRLPVLHDMEVFTRPGDEIESSLSVDILLDASSSRARYQEAIATQAYILSRSLDQIHVRNRFLDFHSLRGFTVLEILKDYEDRDRRGIFRYSAAGWNRDGLALLLAARLLRAAEAKDSGKHILLIMTDANPSDSTRIPPKGKDVFLHAYGNEEGVADTEDAVKQIREQGITLGAIYTGPNLYMKNVKRIYGNDFVRIQKVDQLAGGVSELIQNLLIRMKN